MTYRRALPYLSDASHGVYALEYGAVIDLCSLVVWLGLGLWLFLGSPEAVGAELQLMQLAMFIPPIFGCT